MTDREKAIRNVIRAWTKAGWRPDYHHAMQATLHQKWPVLADALEDLADAGHLLPDLPEPDNTYPEWKIGNQSIVKGIRPGDVGLEWEDREDTGRGTIGRSLCLTPDQVRSIIAAHYHRKDQE